MVKEKEKKDKPSPLVWGEVSLDNKHWQMTFPSVLQGLLDEVALTLQGTLQRCPPTIFFSDYRDTTKDSTDIMRVELRLGNDDYDTQMFRANLKDAMSYFLEGHCDKDDKLDRENGIQRDRIVAYLEDIVKTMKSVEVRNDK